MSAISKLYRFLALMVVGGLIAVNVPNAYATDTIARERSVATSATLGDNLVINGDFEAPTLDGWAVDYGDVELISNSLWPGVLGQQSLDLDGNVMGGISQTLPTIAGKNYLLRFAMAGNPDMVCVDPGIIKTMEVWWAGSLVVTVTFDVTGHTREDLGWVYHEYPVTAVDASTQLKFYSLTPGCHGPVIDNVSVQVPQQVTISGTVGVSGAMLSYVDGTPKSVMSIGFGLYSLTVPYGWSGTVTPLKDGYTFFPPSLSYNNVLKDQLEQDYIAKQPVIDYWALGDSIASGHGLKDDDTKCRRSTNAYPYLVNEALKERYVTVNFQQIACSGATVRQPDSKTLKDDKFKWFQNQVDYVIANLSDRPTLVTITIGANDFGWSNIVDFAVRLKTQDENKYVDWVDRMVDDPNSGIEVLLAKQVQRLLSYPNISIVLTEIHNPVNPKSSLFAGTTFANGCGWSADYCYTRTKYLVTKLNGAIIQVMLDYHQFDRLQVAAIQSKFEGHESAGVCGLQSIEQTYVQYPFDGYSNSWSALPDWMRKALHIDKGGDCFHPNLEGVKVYASAVNEDAIRVGK